MCGHGQGRAWASSSSTKAKRAHNLHLLTLMYILTAEANGSSCWTRRKLFAWSRANYETDRFLSDNQHNPSGSSSTDMVNRSYKFNLLQQTHARGISSEVRAPRCGRGDPSSSLGCHIFCPRPRCMGFSMHCCNMLRRRLRLCVHQSSEQRTEAQLQLQCTHEQLADRCHCWTD